MILGIGVRLCQVDRIRRSLEAIWQRVDWTSFFLLRTSVPFARTGQDPDFAFRSSFCGKEACSKALQPPLDKRSEQ